MAAQYGTAIFRTLTRVPQAIPVQIYCDDTAGNKVLWDDGGGDAADGQTKWTAPVPCFLADFLLAAATGQTKTSLSKSGARIATLLNAVHLASVTVRPQLNILLRAGQEISGNQIA